MEENQKQYCENLYQEYRKLEAEVKGAFLSQEYISGKDLSAGKPLPTENIEKRYMEVKKELTEKCKSDLVLKPDEWFEIEKG